MAWSTRRDKVCDEQWGTVNQVDRAFKKLFFFFLENLFELSSLVARRSFIRLTPGRDVQHVIRTAAPHYSGGNAPFTAVNSVGAFITSVITAGAPQPPFFLATGGISTSLSGNHCAPSLVRPLAPWRQLSELRRGKNVPSSIRAGSPLHSAHRVADHPGPLDLLSTHAPEGTYPPQGPSLSFPFGAQPPPVVQLPISFLSRWGGYWSPVLGTYRDASSSGGHTGARGIATSMQKTLTASATPRLS